MFKGFFLAAGFGLLVLAPTVSVHAGDYTKADATIARTDALEVQKFLRAAGCLVDPGRDGIWREASAKDFRTFLEKTGQSKKYDSKLTVAQIQKRLFEGYVPRAGRAGISCDPIQSNQCDFKKEIAVVLNKKENDAMKQVFLKVYDLNRVLPTGYPVGGAFFADEKHKEYVVQRFARAETELRDLFRDIVAKQRKECGLCNYVSTLAISQNKYLSPQFSSQTAFKFSKITKDQLDDPELQEKLKDWQLAIEAISVIDERRRRKPDKKLDSAIARAQTELDADVKSFFDQAAAGPDEKMRPEDKENALKRQALFKEASDEQQADAIAWRLAVTNAKCDEQGDLLSLVTR